MLKLNMKKILYWICSIVIVVCLAEYNSHLINANTLNTANAPYTVTKNDSIRYSFSGEIFPYKNVKKLRQLEYFEKEVTKMNKETMYLVSKSKAYFKVIEPILKKNGVPDDFKYLAVTESGLRNSSVSPVNALGVWQLMSVTATELGLTVNNKVDERLDLSKSTEAICKLLKKNKAYFGTWTEALIAFNMGNTALYTFQKNQGNYNNIYKLKMYNESAEIIYKVLAYKHLFNNLEKYGFANTTIKQTDNVMFGFKTLELN